MAIVFDDANNSNLRDLNDTNVAGSFLCASFTGTIGTDVAVDNQAVGMTLVNGEGTFASGGAATYALVGNAAGVLGLYTGVEAG